MTELDTLPLPVPSGRRLKIEALVRLFFLVAAFLALLLNSWRAEGHSHYTDWRTPSGGSCCNNQDCRPVPHKVDGEGLWLRINGNWWLASPKEAPQLPSIDENAHACFYPSSTKPHCWAAPQWTG